MTKAYEYDEYIGTKKLEHNSTQSSPNRESISISTASSDSDEEKKAFFQVLPQMNLDFSQTKIHPPVQEFKREEHFYPQQYQPVAQNDVSFQQTNGNLFSYIQNRGILLQGNGYSRVKEGTNIPSINTGFVSSEQYHNLSSSAISNQHSNNTGYSNNVLEANIDKDIASTKERYKTELCKNFQVTGMCNYGKKCQFAHGKQELLVKPEQMTNQYYKTRPCKEFFNTLTCPYGQRCKYSHSIESLQKFNLNISNTNISYHNDQISRQHTGFYEKRLQLLGVQQIPAQNRLPIFKKLTSQ